MMAVWFTALLVLSIVPAIAPTASATHITAASAQFVVTDDDGATYFPYDGRIVGPGDKIGLNISANVGEACLAGLPTAGQAIPHINNRIFSSDPTVVLALQSGTSVYGELRFTVVGNFELVNGVEGSDLTFAVDIDRTCQGQVSNPGTPLPEPTTTIQSSPITADTRKPRLPAITFTYTNSTLTHVDVPTNVNAPNLSIGTTITFTPIAIDSMGIATGGFFAELSRIGAGNQTNLPPAGAPISRTIPSSDTPGAPSLDNVTNVPIWINATDVHGNVNSTRYSFGVDNVRPEGTSLLFHPIASVLNRTMADPRTGGLETNVLRLAWNGTPDHFYTQIRYTINDGTTETVAGGIHNRTDERFDTCDTGLTGDQLNVGNEGDCGLTFTSPSSSLTNKLNLVMYPADGAGNVNTDATARRTIDLPHIALKYGRPSGSNLPFVGGSVLDDLRVTLSGSIAPKPAGSTTWTNNPTGCPDFGLLCTSPNSLLYGQLLRYTGTDTDGVTYWKNPISGNGNAGSLASNFQPVPVLNPTLTSTDPTFFRAPVGGYTNSTDIYLANLSALPGTGHAARSFLDGLYNIALNASNESLNSFVNYNFTMRIDGDKPDASNHVTYTTARGHPGQGTVTSATSANPTNMTDLHGMDGNPIRLLANVTDFHVEAGTESGIANVTIELIDLNKFGHPLVQRTTGAPCRPAEAQFSGCARLDIRTTNCATGSTLDYCLDMSEFPTPWTPSVYAPGGLCGSENHNEWPPARAAKCAAYRGITPWTTPQTTPPYANLTQTFFNNTQFAGWINSTFSDLPSGNFSIRLLAKDKSGNEVTTPRIFQDGTPSQPYYQVAPAVRLLSDLNSPRIVTKADGTKAIDVTVLAGQRYFAPADDGTLNGTFASACEELTSTAPGDWCPADRVRIYVSTTGTDSGTLYAERFGDGITADGQAFSVKGFAGGRDATNGQLIFTDPNAKAGDPGVSVKLFPFSSTFPPSLSSSLASAPKLYVRAEAIDWEEGTYITKVSRFTEWVQVATGVAPTLTVNAPGVEWQINYTAQSGADHVRPYFNFSFDNKGEPGNLEIEYKITKYTSTSTGTLINTVTRTAENANTKALADLYYWSGRLTQSGSSSSDPALTTGMYRLDVTVKQDGGVRASAQRNFTIISAKPVVSYDAVQSDPHLVKEGADYVVPQSFNIQITVDHDDVNLTGFVFNLKRLDAPPGLPTDFTSNGDGGGTGGFKVTIVTGLPLSEFDAHTSDRASPITAFVELPSGFHDANALIFTTTAKFSTFPFTVTNSSNAVRLVFDKVPPGGSLDLDLTKATIFDTTSGTGTNPPKNLPASTRHPKFVGTAQDLGAGVKMVEARIYDNTTKETIILTTSPNGVLRVSGPNNLASGFFNSTPFTYDAGAGPVDARFIRLEALDDGVTWKWTIDLDQRTNLPQLYDPAADTGVFNMSHEYIIDVFFTDTLDQRSQVLNSTAVRMDFAPPFLGYKNQLGTSPSIPSGINTVGGKRQINWNGVGDSLVVTVNVTDNHCIAAVRLVGNSSVNPGVIVKANMTPHGYPKAYTPPAAVPYDPIADASKICPNGNKVEYRLDLANARDVVTGQHFLNDVGKYRLWWEADDWSGRTSDIPGSPVNYRTLDIEVLDSSPAVVHSVTLDPPVGQAGGRALVRARVFENLNLSHVELTVTNFTSGAVLARKNMTAENGTGAGFTWWRVDTTDDLGLELAIGEYKFNVTAYDVNWNRTINPTCVPICQPLAALYIVRDDGNPAVVLESPLAGATVNATPTLKFRALHKNLETTQISVRATLDGNATNLTTVGAGTLNFTELKSANGTRQGWTVAYTPAGPLADNATLLVNVTATIASLFDSREYSFRVDAAGPSVTHNVTGGTTTIAGKEWATPATRVILRANDTVSATTIKYTVNGGPEQTYTSEITPGGADGEWKLEYWASDAAGNLAAKNSVTLNVDVTGPRISVAKHGDDLLLTVTDSGAGLNESTVTVHYRYGGAAAFTPKKADKLTGNSFGTTLAGNASESGLAYYFTAQDLLGNDGSNYSAAQPYTIRAENVTPVNLPPTIRITSPTAGQDVRSSVEVKWIAEDPEEAPLTISIALQQPPPGRVLVAAGENSGTYTINTTGFAAGAYTVVVTATDGEHSESAQVTFNVQQGDSIQVRNVPPPTVQPNTQIGVAIAITAGKTVQSAQYRLIKDGQPFASGVLGITQQGLYAAGFTPSIPGNYTVVVDVAYADGTSEPSKQIATFSVPAPVTPPDEGAAGLMPTSVMVLLAVAILTVALAAYGAFGRWKK